VGVGGPLAGVPSLEIDEVAIARLATEHLIMLGRITIHIGGSSEEDTDFHIGSHRRAGFEQAMTTAGLPVPAESMIASDFTVAGGYAHAKQALGHPTTVRPRSSPHPTRWRSGAPRRDSRLWRVPRDVSIVGIDDQNSRSSSSSPRFAPV
jgi:DNA-binding LacI/PurR family transcriptional regulator